MGVRGVSALLGAALLLLLVPSASAASLVQNSGFELSCQSGSVPCNWESLGGAFAWDNTTAAGGSASARLTGPGTAATIRSDCVTLSASGLYSNRFFYRALASGSAPATVAWFVYHYSDGNCTPAMFLFGNGPSFVPVTADGQWHQTPLQFLFIDNTVGSVQLGLGFECGTLPCSDPVTRTAWFDDTDFEPPSTAVTVSGLMASSGRGGISVRWRTSSETGLLGFNVYRRAGGRSARLNSVLIRVANRPTGSGYTFLDRSAPPTGTVRYRLQVVRLDGTAIWSGTVTAHR